mgnify:FL=1
MPESLQMTASLKIALAQINPTVGAVAQNRQKAEEVLTSQIGQGADLVVFPELYLAGYPPEDLVLKPAFQDACRREAEALAEACGDGPAVLIGAPWREDGALYNALLLLRGGRIDAVRYKHHLPNYGVFDEIRVFAPGPLPEPLTLNGVSIGVPICEDMWFPDVAAHLKAQGAELLIAPNGSPFTRDKKRHREDHVLARAAETGLPVIYVNQVGGQDELVFDGGSFAAAPDGAVPLRLPRWREAVEMTIWRQNRNIWQCESCKTQHVDDDLESIWLAAVLGLRDYVEKNRFSSVVLGLSGGIDSAVCAAMAVDALGPKRVQCIMLPYLYTSAESLDDAAACAEALGVDYATMPIAPAVTGFHDMLAPLIGSGEGVTAENIQSRVRGAALMALSNANGAMVVTTGNKSEMSVGYATLYGDMNGGFNPIKDIYKTEVFALARLRNRLRPGICLGPEGEVIPVNIIDKPPSAELRPDQTDQDSLPPYDVLDDILRGLIENEESVADIMRRGHDAALIHRIEHLLYIAEYKRRQSAPGVKISVRNFGRDRRYPITNGFRDRSGQ